MFVKSFTWCSVTVVAILAAALLATAPVSAHSDDTYQNAQIQTQNQNDGDNDQDDQHAALKDPIIHVETGACVFLGDNEGTIGVDVTNPNDHKLVYKVTVNGQTKHVLVAAHDTEYIAFTDLAIGNYAVDVTGPHGTKASGSATIKQCHEHELPTVTVDACGCVAAGDHSGHLTLTINNTNDYAVTYTVRVDGYSQDVFVDSHSSNTLTFSHLAAGDYDISISGDDCTHLCLHATVEQCPEQTQPGQGAGSPTPSPAPTPVTPAPVAAPTASVIPASALPAQLPNTSATDTAPPAVPAAIAAKVPAPTSINPLSVVLIALGLPMIAAAAVIRRGQLNSKA